MASLDGVADQVLVADCFSTDETLAIAQAQGARVVQRAWVNHATQFNWALTQHDGNTDWVLRLDADEYLTPGLAAEIRARVPGLGPEIDGVYCGRRMTFQGRVIRFGGVFPIRVLRLFRYGRGQCENRWMDEHIKVAGPTADLRGNLIDDNLNSLTWWTEKHNRYASREAVDLLNLEYGFMPRDSVAQLRGRGEAVGEGGGIRPSAGGLSGLCLFLLSLRAAAGVSGWAGRHGVSFPAGVLVPLSGGCQGGGGEAVYGRPGL